jgi:hypothetical protein
VDAFRVLLFALCPVGMTTAWSRLLPRLNWWWHALIGGTTGVTLYWGMVIAVVGHLEKFFLLTMFPLVALSGAIAVTTALILSGLKR